MPKSGQQGPPPLINPLASSLRATEQAGAPIIAVVDDDERMRQSIGGLLESAGHAVATFPSAEAFIQAGIAAAANCVVLDVHMPGMDGFQLQQLLRTDLPHLPIIFVTAHSSEGMRRRALSQGAAHFFGKPFDPSELVQAIDNYVNPMLNRDSAGAS